ncbi:hypothetical protein KSC_090950 [Ktedonobacter sp. SOSP1-52]|uniref:non-ribosomal peptide synthetase n=1 Tax=Ktedonobacter sp. SOSP1-52 TaxID=2778366 RepID=UPI001916BFBB|nr:non-ribosomal peptide synthetase [Ktedonobacter sp. SOSP1-52]GHO70203.1 hypothetical protein KSC_090950 [Ktedonobacter sp. SOSP1-52]
MPIQYADYALWQRSWLQGEVLARQLDYWKQQLRGLTPLELPTDQPRPAVQTFHGALHQRRLPRALSQQLHELSQREGVTLFMTLLAAFQVLLSRYSGQQDIAVGTPIANRTREEVEGLIGFFVNTLVLRSDLSGNPAFIELLARVRAMALGAYAHQEVPFEQVVEALQPQRDLSRSPLFQVLFELKNREEDEELSGSAELQAENVALEQHSAKFELSVIVTESPEGLQITLEYSTDLFATSTIQRLLAHWQVLLEGIVATPEQPLSSLPLLTASEHSQLLFEWNQASDASYQKTCVHRIFEAQVEKTPDAVALVCEEGQVTYDQLNQRANQLAHYLQSRDIGPDALVGICVERSLAMVVGMLGVLKAGGAYIPLDPTLPPTRLQLLLEETRAPILLTQQYLLAQLPIQQVQTLCLDTQWVKIAQQSAQQPVSRTEADNLAYMIYTSGSTGHPKGVMISHAALSNHMLWMQTTFPLTPADRVLQKTPASFDASVWEFYAPLLAGACLVLAQPDTHRDSAALALTLAHQQISILQVVPTLLHALLDEPLLPYCHHLRSLFCGGEELRADLLRRAMTSLPPTTRLYNLYGPTEATIDATCWPCEPDPQLARVPIGRPISNLQVYLLDAYLQPVPIGVPGEVFLGGAGLARGYHRRSDLTAEAFLPHPFSSEPGARLYRTGDLARFVPQRSNTLQYLGRRDAQVKLRGYRIEPGEIEAILSTHPAVSAAAVGMQHTRTNTAVAEQRLIAYVVRTPEHALSLQELRSYLGERLPQYMLPSGLVELEQLPLTSSGKVDRRQLATLTVDEEPGNQDTEQRPRNELEELVSQVWKQVLQRDQVGLQENFFELGGHSLLATQVVARLRKLLHTEVPLLLLFEAPTISLLAARLQLLLRQAQGHTQPMPPLLPVPRDQDLPLSFAQQRLWFLHQFAPRSAAYSIPVFARLHGTLAIPALRASLSALIQRHESLRTVFEERQGQVLQRIVQQTPIPFPVIDLSGYDHQQREAAIEQLVEQEAEQPFDLRQGPLLRSWLLRLSPQEHILFLTMHHIVSDGWSMGILVQELTALYQAFRAGEPSPLPPLPIQYADYASWQRGWLQGEVLKEQIRYWTQQLNGARALELPTDYPRTRALSQQGAHYGFQLDAQLAQALRQLSQQEGATLFMTLLAAFQILLYRLSGQEDIVVGTDSANRSHLETEKLIGFFVNLLALRGHVNGKLPFHDFLHTMREVIINAYTHQDFPFEMIIEHLHLQREGSRTPLINALFVMQNVPLTDAELPDLTITSIDSDTTSAKFDMALFVTEEPAGLGCSVAYSTDLFKEATIERIMNHYAALLQAIVTHPETPIDHLEIYSKEEEQQRTVQKKKSLQRHLSKLKDFKEDMIDLS